jgi:hypothetical protein
VIVSDNERCLLNLIPKIKAFLTTKLKLEIHPNKILIRKFRQGIDFLGFVVFPKHRLLRTKTKRRIFQKLKLGVKEYKTGLISEETIKQSLNSYLGVLSHANTYELHQELENQYWFWLRE